MPLPCNSLGKGNAFNCKMPCHHSAFPGQLEGKVTESSFPAGAIKLEASMASRLGGSGCSLQTTLPSLPPLPIPHVPSLTLTGAVGNLDLSYYN